jgi:hypothetical protein
VPSRGLFRAAAPPVGAAAIAAGAVWASTQLTQSSWQALVLGGLVGIGVYLALLHRWLRSRFRRISPRNSQDISAADVPVATFSSAP